MQRQRSLSNFSTKATGSSGQILRELKFYALHSSNPEGLQIGFVDAITCYLSNHSRILNNISMVHYIFNILQAIDL